MKIFFLDSKNVYILALKQSISTMNPLGVQFVENSEEADLVVATDIRQISLFYNPEKQYAVVSTSFLKEKEAKKLPSNITVFDPPLHLLNFITFLKSVESSEEEKVSAELLPDAKTILVVDDTKKHRRSAKRLLAGHRLTAVDGYEAAMEVLREEEFEVVLTDLKLPMSSRQLGDVFEFGKEIDYGILLALEAAWRGAKYVAVATDLSHHHDPFSASFDYFSQHVFRVEEGRVLMMHASMTSDGEKD